jgi:hypothetical protein
LTYLQAAIAVLMASRRPLTVAEITGEALRKGLIDPAGKTPKATMSATLYVCSRGAASSVIAREFQPGPQRAVRNSVRWRYSG